jgi:PRC-barrel domain protein
VELGPPASYLTLEAGTPVFTSDGERLGEVEHVLAVPDEDIFEGLVVATGGHRFVDSSQVDRVYERGVALTLDAAAARALPEPSESPASMSASPDDTVEGDLERKLRRAWDLISGRY